MPTVPRLDLSAFPDSAYAAELQRGSQHLRFTAKLEAEYVRDHLIRSHTLIRVVCVLAILFGSSRAVEHLSSGASDTFVLVSLAFVISVSIILTAIAWSPAFERVYLPWAGIVVPVRNSVVAISIAMAAGHGQLEVLTMLPLILIGPFFFLGLRFRTALLSGVMTVISFMVSAAAFELALPIALRLYAFLVMGLVACAIAARHLEHRARISFLETRLIAELAEHDALTGMKNRRIFDEHLLRLWRQAIEDRCTIAVLLIDVDHFKAYNDRYGHQAGDQALRRVAQHVQTFVRRPLDILARYGGEEFAVVLYGVDLGHAVKVADRIRHAVEELNIEHAGSQTSSGVTISVGLAVVQPTPKRNPHGALQLADQALYEAKLRGRNKVKVMNEEDYRMLETGSFSRASASR
jgi:diguanylate cyclase (GGDEF)-like protein